MKILNSSLLSIVAVAYLLSFAGCVDDRALFGQGKSISEEGEVIEDPNGDPDHDGLTNQEEKEIGTTSTDPDTDDDGLDDGLEHNVTKTNPLLADTDGDGVTDGIEVVGTYPENIDPAPDSGKVITAGKEKISLKIGEEGLKVLDLELPLSSVDSNITNFWNKQPANINHNKFTDPEDQIDALDPFNDSDYDKRPNKPEADKGTDPLDKNSFYPWIYETPQGIAMEDNGFIYVPAIDGDGGFWMSQYEARPVALIAKPYNINFPEVVQKDFKMITGEAPSGFTSAGSSDTNLFTVNFNNSGNSVKGIYGFEAAYMLDNSQINDANATKIGLPSLKQYTHVVKLLNSNKVENSVIYYDFQVEEDYKRDIFELQSGVKEFTSTIINLPYAKKVLDGIEIRKNPEGLAYVGSSTNGNIGMTSNTALAILGTGFIDLRYSISYADNGTQAIGFRAASDYIK
jgi:hypothetical protein